MIHSQATTTDDITIADVVSIIGKSYTSINKHPLQYSWDKTSTDGWNFIDVLPHNSDLIATGIKGIVSDGGEVIVPRVNFHGGFKEKLHHIKADLARGSRLHTARVKRLVYLNSARWINLITNLQRSPLSRPYLLDSDGEYLCGYGFSDESIMKYPWLLKTSTSDPLNEHRKNIWLNNVRIDAVCITNGEETIYVVCSQSGQQVGI